MVVGGEILLVDNWVTGGEVLLRTTVGLVVMVAVPVVRVKVFVLVGGETVVVVDLLVVTEKIFGLPFGSSMSSGGVMVSLEKVFSI